MRRRLTLLVVVLAAALAIAAPTAGAAGWVLPATPLAPVANGPSGAVVAVAPDGDAVAAWTGDDGLGVQSLLVAARPAGGVWSTPEPLVQNAGVDGPSIAIDAQGDATVLWVESGDGVAFAARAARRDAGSGTWGAPHDFAPAGTALPLTQLRATAAGDAVAAWVEYDDGDGVSSVRAAMWSGATWGAAETVSDPSAVSVASGRPQIAPDAAGGALVAWTAQQLDDPFEYAIQTSARGGGAWSAPADVVTSALQLTPVRLVGVEGGGAAASWFEGSPPALWGGLRTGGTWTVDHVSDDVAPACEPLQALGADPGGGATVAWRAQSSDGLESVRLTDGGLELPPRTVFAARSEAVHEAAIDGDTIVLVTADLGTNAYSVLGTRRTAGGAWGAPALLASGPAGGELGAPDVSSDAAGNALAAWSATDALAAKGVAVGGFQASGPQLTAVSVPSSGTAGEALALSASAQSVFATVVQTTWDFGDGTPLASGSAVVHAYAQAGTYTVTVSATDSVGNATSTTRDVTIAPAPPPDPLPPSPTPPSPPPGPPTPSPTPPATLARPQLVARNGVVRLARRSNTLKLVFANANAARLSGRVTLVRPRSGRRPALTLAVKRGVALRGDGRTTLALALGADALRTLRLAPGRRLAVQVALRLRAGDGRPVTASRLVTLDASARFPAASSTRAQARIAC